jgi:hypothetical protein
MDANSVPYPAHQVGISDNPPENQADNLSDHDPADFSLAITRPDVSDRHPANLAESLIQEAQSFHQDINGRVELTIAPRETGITGRTPNTICVIEAKTGS